MCSASELQTILYHVAQAYHRVFGNHIEQILCSRFRVVVAASPRC